MSNRNVYRFLISMLLACMLTACGGGGGSGEGAPGVGQGTSGLAFPLNVVVENAKFLLFPNPQRQGLVGAQPVNGLDQTNTQAYADAYYSAIDNPDPALKADTLAKWKNRNGFGNSATGTEITVVFGDQKDLGYGRRMTARKNNDTSLAFLVDNYLVNTGSAYTYSSLNVDAAVVQSPQRLVSTSAIEFSNISGTGAGAKFVKFYVFDANGNRKTLVDQDGLGLKAMPNICVNCHGGRADPLTSMGAFPIVGNSISQAAGDTLSRLQTLKVHTFDFSRSAGFTRGEQESQMREINQWVHDSYPTTLPATNEWDGTVARNLIEAAYGGSDPLNGNYQDTIAKNFLPPDNALVNDWTGNGQEELYRNVLAPACMTCHMLRGTKIQNPTTTNGDIAFATFTQFNSYADRIKVHVYDRGNMPLAKIVFDEFWGGGSIMPQRLAIVPDIAAQGATQNLKPGRPIADPGPDRFVRPGVLSLSAINSLYASTFTWSIQSNPGNGASFTGSSTDISTSVNFSSNGTYVIRLNATGNGLSNTKDLTVLVDAAAPANVKFGNIKTIMANCQVGCHQAPLTGANRPPVSYDENDYPGATQPQRELAFYKAVLGRVNFSDVIASPLLRKPSGKHHRGDLVGGFDTSSVLGSGGRSNYDTFVEWIMVGAPQN